MNKNPIVPFLLIIFLGIGLVFLLSGLGSTDDGEEDVATEEGSEGSEESGGDEASSGDVDAEGIARDNCASCHGQDFSGGMGPALAGTSLAEEDFTTTVREGQGSMPAFSADQIADEELTALYQFFSEQ
ncbi:cytochrome c [Jeotgalicoccus halotolerans]|jgi:Cytochrome c, mono- and diheme variants|uniref:Cytochrome c n=1 Tax=Jeotgalicoccus nanhaiensis TaxID=568603 RepID=A0ABR9XW81_9STAP|nr:cytochrome c [Jeotgalicoccus nanhaiensis]MBF0753280.1 cytochrome c [Jeotgalicoccus nanhaiensis]TFU62450.1 cytochrome c [Jeotgalicoccus nanhaiensis]